MTPIAEMQTRPRGFFSALFGAFPGSEPTILVKVMFILLSVSLATAAILWLYVSAKIGGSGSFFLTLAGVGIGGLIYISLLRIGMELAAAVFSIKQAVIQLAEVVERLSHQ